MIWIILMWTLIGVIYITYREWDTKNGIIKWHDWILFAPSVFFFWVIGSIATRVGRSHN